MLNLKILFILQLLLFIKVNSSLSEDIDTDLFSQELSKCISPFFINPENSGIDVDKCTAISPSKEFLEFGEMYKGRCCKMTISVDTLLNYKKMYNENWKKKIINQFDLDEDITEEEIRNKYLPPKDQESCLLLLDSFKNDFSL